MRLLFLLLTVMITSCGSSKRDDSSAKEMLLEKEAKIFDEKKLDEKELLPDLLAKHQELFIGHGTHASYLPILCSLCHVLQHTDNAST